MVQSQWGPVHLFDLCLRCDHLGMALALAAHDVPGCIFEDHHLGPISGVYSDRPCSCQGWSTCPYCCWGFPVDQGIWMEDWDEALFDRDYEAPTEESELGAIPAADVAAATPLTRAMLDICSRDMELPFSGSPKAIARLLDIAILTGNQKAAFNLSQKCQLRPLRRWAFQWYRFRSEVFWKAARAALWAGADFQDLIVQYNEDVPFPQALFLKSELEDWQKIRHLLPRGHDLWRPKNLDNRLGKFFLKGPQRPRGSLQLSLDKIRAAEDAGVDVQCCLNWIFDVFEDEDDDGDIAAVVTLLDVAIWCGQPDCAEAVVDAGIELKGDDMTLAWHKRVLRGEGVRMASPTPETIS